MILAAIIAAALGAVVAIVGLLQQLELRHLTRASEVVATLQNQAAISTAYSARNSAIALWLILWVVAGVLVLIRLFV